MLKKIVHIVFGILLVVATTGFTISKHYCGNHLFSVSIFKADKCGCGDNCKDCHTILKLVKVTDNYSAPDAIHPDAPISAALFTVNPIDFSFFTSPAVTTAFTLLKAPPPGTRNSFAFLQTFRC